jgi:DNA mismatch repair protein MutS2
MNQDERTLELDKILELLAQEASNDITRERARHLQPNSDLAVVQAELEKTDSALALSVQFGTPPFYAFQDMCTALQRAKAGAKLSLKDLMEIARVLRQVQALSDWYDHCSGVETPLDDWFSRLAPVPFLLEKLDRCILSEEELSDAASPALADIRRKLLRAGQRLRDTLDKMIRNQDVQKCLQDARVTIRDGRFVLPVKAEHRGEVQGLIHDTSSSGQTLFIEPLAVVDANNDMRLLESLEQEEIDRIITELCADCGTWADAIIADHAICAELNLYFAKANLAAKMHAFRPVVTDDGVLDLKNARHPLIPAEKVVPISFSLGREQKTLIITGPNTGGKTVALKTAGLLTLMTMCGLLIPAAEGSQISVFETVFANIGDTQSIEQNLSTFSAHMKQVISILERADERSLVLLDELGSGTDPVEGAALAIAILERLHQNGAKLMVTTHYQELKLYATEHPEVENASCEFDIVALKPTYRLILGSPGKSNAFAITEGLGMDASIIHHAQSLVSEENVRFERAVEKLEQTRQTLEEQLQSIQTEKQQAEAAAAQAKQELAEIRAQKAEKMEQARLQAMQIVEQTRAESNALLEELDKLRKEKERASFADDVIAAKSGSKRRFRHMYETANPLEEQTNESYVLPRALKIGDTVMIADTKQKGTVVSLPDHSNRLFVQVGIMKTKMQLEQLRLVTTQQQKKQEKQKQATRTGRVSAKTERSGSMELDIRGCTCDEGVYQMDAFLDRAVLSHVTTVTVIHGKGRGQLRQAVHQRLKQLKYVKSYRLGAFGEGEDGVTIVTLA